MITKRQREIIIGTILGDGYLQKTGKKNARLKLEHSEKQRDYIFWKYQELKNLMQDKPKKIVRYNPKWKKEYIYYRCQTHSMPFLGKLKRYFYDDNGKKVIPTNIKNLLKSELSLAVWYMDDGYYYKRDEVIYIYLPKYKEEELERLKLVLKDNFDVEIKVIYKKGYPCIYLNKEETKKFFNMVGKYIVECMRYKTPLDPVTTGGEKPKGST
jgi:hypothetical protein